MYASISTIFAEFTSVAVVPAESTFLSFFFLDVVELAVLAWSCFGQLPFFSMLGVEFKGHLLKR
jgi:hypothetical protein